MKEFVMNVPVNAKDMSDEEPLPIPTMNFDQSSGTEVVNAHDSCECDESPLVPPTMNFANRKR
jgi:hypothetical protein